WQAIDFAVSFIMVAGLFALMFKMLPRVSVAWGDVLIGSVFTALLFNIGKLLIGLYIGKTGAVSGFGAAGSVIAMVLWVYYSAQIFLFGAEFTWLFAKKFGSLRETGKGVLKNGEEIIQLKNVGASEKRPIPTKTLGVLLKKLLQDGKGWLAAELTLAK